MLPSASSTLDTGAHATGEARAVTREPRTADDSPPSFSADFASRATSATPLTSAVSCCRSAALRVAAIARRQHHRRDAGAQCGLDEIPTMLASSFDSDGSSSPFFCRGRFDKARQASTIVSKPP